MAYGSATSSFQWYSWFAGTGLARLRRRTRQTDRRDSMRSSPAWLAGWVARNLASPHDPAAAGMPQSQFSRENSRCLL